MADRTSIEWTDATWNPVTGCTEVSPGCDHCYAKTFAERWRGTKGHHFERGFDVQLRPERLDQPLRWRTPRRIFVNSMSDLFHDAVPDEYIAKVFAVMALAGQHTFQVLTKRHGRMRALLNASWFITEVWTQMYIQSAGESLANPQQWPLPNVWLGVSVEDQKWADIRVPALLDTPAAVRWVSCEPLLGAVDLVLWLRCDHASESGTADPDTWECDQCGAQRREVADPDGTVLRIDATGHRWIRYDPLTRGRLLDWVVVGGESGPGARPMHPGWARSLRDQCQRTGVPFLFKQWGAWAPVGLRSGAGHSIFDYVTNDHRCQVVDLAGQLRGRPWPGWAVQDGTRDAAAMRRYGKHTAGRVLDGQTWDQYPRTDLGNAGGGR